MAEMEDKKKRKREKKAKDETDAVKPRKSKKSKTAKSSTDSATASFNLAAANAAFDPTLSSLFSNSLGPSKPSLPKETPTTAADDDVDADDDDEILSELDEELDDEADQLADSEEEQGGVAVDNDADAEKVAEAMEARPDAPARKRKRKDEHDDLEGDYMRRLEREEDKATATLKADRKRQRAEAKAAKLPDEEDEADPHSDMDDDDVLSESDLDEASPPPQHESLAAESSTSDLDKSQRTVFLSNVSTTAIASKSARKTLLAHLSSFFPSLPPLDAVQPAHKIESIRFRSTAYATAIPKKAAFAKKELMDATTKSTNAYAIYSSTLLAREAARRLNGTMVLDRHIRVDEVAHPAKTDHKRCVFVGNLGFVDDESNIDAANAEEGREKRKGKKQPGDVEEGLWRTFAKCGTVESVRVIRDSKTRVGKGFAYVQFTDENAVEAALQYNEKRFPPLLPRKLRVMRAKSVKRNAKPAAASTRAPAHTRSGPQAAVGAYNPKMTAQQQSQLGRAGKLLGRAAAAQLRSGGGDGSKGGSMPARTPESFVFEGHRASSKQGKSGLKLGGGGGGGGKKKGKPTTRSSKRGTAWKAGGGRQQGK